MPDIARVRLLVDTNISLSGAQTIQGIPLVAGVAEVVRYAVTSAADADGGNIEVVLGNLDGTTTTYTVPVAANDTAITVANKIANLAGGYAGWSAVQGTSPSDHEVTFTAAVGGVRPDASYNASTGGATATVSTLTEGSDGDTVAVAAQDNAVENGIYMVQSTAWSRRLDFDAQSEAIPGTDFYISEGTHDGEIWYLYDNSNTIIGTESVVFLQRGRKRALRAGNGLAESSEGALSIAPSGVGDAGTVSNPASVSYGSDGRITAISAGASTTLEKGTVRLVATSNTALSGTPIIDGVQTVAGDEVAVISQDAPATNGIYVVAAGAWARRADLNESVEFTPGIHVRVREGAAHADRMVVFTGDSQPTLGTTALTFKFDPEVGAGLEQSANRISLSDSGVVGGTYGGDVVMDIAATGIVSSASRTYGEETYVKGLRLSRTADGIGVDAGAAYIPHLGYVIESAGGEFFKGNGLADRFQYVYLRGTSGQILFFTGDHAPAPYAGYAATKGGSEASPDYRYIGVFRERNGFPPFTFTVEGDGNNPFVRYLEAPNIAPFRVLTAGTAITATTVSCAAVVPPTAKFALIRFLNTSNQQAFLSNSEAAADIEFIWTNPTDKDVIMPLDAAQAFTYYFPAAPTSGGLYADVLGYYERR